MPVIIDPSEKKESTKKSRILWFIGLYLAGLVATGLVVYILKALLGLN